jgi:hypothetical protein
MTLLEQRLTEAMDKNKKDLNNYSWKGEKILTHEGIYQQDEKKLIDMGIFELKSCYSHCVTMLFNKDPKNPGRYIVLDIIKDQMTKCGVELFLRYVEKEHQMTRSGLIGTISNFLKVNRETFKDITPILKDMFSGIPAQYEEIPIEAVLDGCLDKLGTLNKKHITRTFVLKQGLWLTGSEVKDFPAKDPRERLDLIRETLGIKEVEKLYINSKGINYTQMRAMLNLKPYKKYTELTTIQLETLRYRLLHSLESSVNKHIESWEQRMSEIEEVAEFKGIVL